MSENPNVITKGHGYNPIDPEVINERVNNYSNSAALGKVFGIAAIGVLITAALTMVLGYFMVEFLLNTETTDLELYGNVWIVYIVMLVVAFIGVMIIPYLVQRSARKGGVKALWAQFIIYAILFGVFLSSFAFVLSPIMIGMAFAVSALIFAVMALIGILTKGKLKVLAQIAIGLGFGILVVGAFAFLIFATSLFVPLFAGEPGTLYAWNETVQWIFFGLMTLIFIFTCITTIMQVNSIKKAAQQYQLQKSEVLFFGFMMFSNYTIMLMYVLRILAIFARRK